MTLPFEASSTDLHLSVNHHLSSIHLLFHKQQLLSIKLLADQVIHQLSGDECSEIQSLVEELIESIEENLKNNQFGDIIRIAREIVNSIDPESDCYSLIRDLHSYLSVYLKMVAQESTSFQEQVQFTDLSKIDTVAAYQKIIDPLSNQKRLDIMLAIHHKKKRFKDLENELDLQAGHLIYHLNPLKEGDYIKQDAQKSYFLTEKGLTILEAIQQIYKTYLE